MKPFTKSVLMGLGLILSGHAADLGVTAAANAPDALSQAREGESGDAGRAAMFEVSPVTGFMGGSALIGVRASMNYRPVTLEMAAEQVMGRRATLYPLSMNVVLDLTDSRKTVPYGIVGGGLFLTVPLNSVGDETVSSVGLNFGGGLRYYLFPKLGIRFETKQMFTRIDNRQDHRKELLIFQSTSLGVIFAFG